jgi:hypothetical protein
MSEPIKLTENERMFLKDYPLLEEVLDGDAVTLGEIRPELLTLVRRVTSVMVKCEKDQSYAAAMISFLDRDGSMEKKALCYPITRVELMNVFNDRTPEKARAFMVNDGIWSEEQ